MTRLVEILYVGNKPTAYDNIARSGAVWQGPGDVQKVTDAQAKLLLKYPDQWSLVNRDDQELVNAPVSISVEDEDGDEVAIDPEVLRKPLERMSKSELRALAKDRWGKDLSVKQSTKTMIDQIEEWERDLDIIQNRPA